MTLMIVLGLPVGLLFGFVLQRGGFCLNSAFREILFSRDGRLFKAYLIALLIQMGFLGLFEQSLQLQRTVAPVWWLAAGIGGFIFGVGMVLSRGCSSGNYYRLGEGLIGAYVVVAFFAGGILITDSGLLAPLRVALRAETLGVPPTLDGWSGIDLRWWALLLAGGLTLWLWRGKWGATDQGRWHWLAGGTALGLVAALAWVTSSMTGRYYGLSIIQPTQAWSRWLVMGDAALLNWSAFVLLALPFGAALGALASGGFAWRLPYPTRILQQMGGGLLMGIGGTLAGGCNIGHSLTGVAALSITSLMATAAIMLGCWSGVYLFFVKMKVPR